MLPIKKKNNNGGIDFIKLILAIGVILLHVIPNTDYTFWIGNGICRLAVPFFFFVSGFYSYNFFEQKKIGFIRFSRFLSPYIISFFVWFCVYLYFVYTKIIVGISFTNIFVYLSKILYVLFYKEGYFHLWYVLATIYAFIFFFILKKRNIKEYRISILAIFLFLLGVFSTTYSCLIKPLTPIFPIVRFIGYPLTFAFPMIYLGYFIHKKKFSLYPYLKSKFLLVVLLVLFCVEFSFVWFYITGNKFFDMFFLQPFVIPTLFFYAQDLHINDSRGLQVSGEIYFLHPLIIYLVLQLGVISDSILLEIISVILCTYIIAFLIHPYLYKFYRIVK